MLDVRVMLAVVNFKSCLNISAEYNVTHFLRNKVKIDLLCMKHIEIIALQLPLCRKNYKIFISLIR